MVLVSTVIRNCMLYKDIMNDHTPVMTIILCAMPIRVSFDFGHNLITMLLPQDGHTLLLNPGINPPLPPEVPYPTPHLFHPGLPVNITVHIDIVHREIKGDINVAEVREDGEHHLPHPVVLIAGSGGRWGREETSAAEGGMVFGTSSDSRGEGLRLVLVVGGGG